MTDLSVRLDGIPIVANATERDGRFPVPSLNQRVHVLAVGQIQRWNGTSWVVDFLAGNLAVGSPAILDEGVQVLPIASALDFIGADVSVTADGTVARIVVAGGGGVAIPPVSPATDLAFCGVGVTVVPGTPGQALVGITGGARRDVAFTTGLLSVGATVEGSVAIGATARLLKVTMDRAAWVRFYRSAAERAADTRGVAEFGDDPTTPVIWEGLTETGDLVIDLLEDIWGSNRDEPALNVWYYRITRSDGSGGFTPPADDVGDELPGGVSDAALDAVTPTIPGSPGFTQYEYLGGSGAWVAWQYGGAYCDDGAGAPETAVARTNVDVGNDNLRATLLLGRGWADGLFSVPGAGFAWCIPDTSLGSWDGDDYLYVGATRQSAATVQVGVYRRNLAGGGSDTVLGSASDIPFALGVAPGDEYHRMVVEIQALEVNVYWADADGSNQVHILGPVTIPDLRTSSRERVGLWQAAWGGFDLSSRLMTWEWLVEPLSSPDISEPVTVTSRVVTVEQYCLPGGSPV